MAEELDSYEWGEANPNRSKYDWSRWCKGDIWRIRRGEDYEIATETMRVTLHAKADQRGLKVRTRKESGGGWEGLVFQFYEPDEDSP